MSKSPHQTETMARAVDATRLLSHRFVCEVDRLLSSGALPEDGYKHNVVLGVALENLASQMLGTLPRDDEDYLNLQHF